MLRIPNVISFSNIFENLFASVALKITDPQRNELRSSEHMIYLLLLDAALCVASLASRRFMLTNFARSSVNHLFFSKALLTI